MATAFKASNCYCRRIQLLFTIVKFVEGGTGTVVPSQGPSEGPDVARDHDQGEWVPVTKKTKKKGKIKVSKPRAKGLRRGLG